MIKRHLVILLLIKICLVLPVRGQNLFDKDDVLNIILRGPVAELLKDRGENPQYHSLTLNYSDAQQKGISVPLRIRVRGNFRRQQGNCGYPPLMLNFSDEFTRGTLFEGQDKIKLVMPCQGDKYVVREFLVYKMYNQVTPMSFRARLVRVTLEETDGNLVAMSHSLASCWKMKTKWPPATGWWQLTGSWFGRNKHSQWNSSRWLYFNT